MARTGGKKRYTREDVIELLATAHAANCLFQAEDIRMSTEFRSAGVGEVLAELEEKLLGRIDYGDNENSDEPWQTDPDDIALRIRESEIEAQMIDAGCADKVRSAEATASVEARHGRSAKLRVFADRLREAGTQKDVYFPSSSEISDIVRGEMDAAVAS